MGRVSALVETILGRRDRHESDAISDAMSGQIILRRPSETLQLRKLMKKQSPTESAVTHSAATSQSMSARFAEVAGSTAAECAAVWCCCPCGLVNLVVLAVVRLPAGLCRKAIKKRRRKKVCMMQQQQQQQRPKRDQDDLDWEMDCTVSGEKWPDKSPSTVVSEMEREMLTKLYGTGFWRSPSEGEQH